MRHAPMLVSTSESVSGLAGTSNRRSCTLNHAVADTPPFNKCVFDGDTDSTTCLLASLGGHNMCLGGSLCWVLQCSTETVAVFGFLPPESPVALSIHCASNCVGPGIRCTLPADAAKPSEPVDGRQGTHTSGCGWERKDHCLVSPGRSATTRGPNHAHRFDPSAHHRHRSAPEL